MFVSTVIPTVGRSTLNTAVKSVLDQKNIDDVNEIIVVNDSGKPLPYAEWMDSDRVRVIDTNHNERSVARNTGAAIAKGDYLHFLDDDDWILPGSFSLFKRLTKKTKAGFIYGGSKLAESADKILYEINMKHKGNCFAQVMAGEWIPTGSYLVKRDIFSKRGHSFHPWWCMKISILLAELLLKLILILSKNRYCVSYVAAHGTRRHPYKNTNR
jgi:glycosyltransferase involved in cell wall biosynthesis